MKHPVAPACAISPSLRRSVPLSLLLLVLLTALTLDAAPFDPAFKPDALDLAASAAFRDQQSAPVPAETLHRALGFTNDGPRWQAPPSVNPRAPGTVHFRIALKKPVPIGSLLGGVGQLRVLKADAPFPGDPNNDAHWLALETPTGQNSPRCTPLPSALETRAILCTVPRASDQTRLDFLRPLAARLFSVTPRAIANADGEFTPASLVTRDHGGRGWRNSGKDQKGVNPRPPISDLEPAWFILSWRKTSAAGAVAESNRETPRLVGLLADDAQTFERIKLFTFQGPDSINPAAGTRDEWKALPATIQNAAPGRWITFAPLTTRGLKIEITKAGRDPQLASLDCLQAFIDLGDEPAPDELRVVKKSTLFPPTAIDYSLATPGKVTLVVDSADGHRVRNLIANIERPAGPLAEHWDLKDEQGRYVSPGTYRWKAITHPPLELRYEMTAYPNVGDHFPDRAPWLSGANGPHGWLADHSPPRAACVAGDKVFLGAPVAESGVSLIETDTDGKKLWGYHSFEAFTGAWWLASDGQTVFSAAPANNFARQRGLDARTEGIWGIDVATKAVRTVALLPPTNTRNRGLQGLATRDGKVYMAIRAPENWLVNAAAPADVDIQNCVPGYLAKRKERFAYEVVPDPRDDFLRLFRLGNNPPGYGPGNGLTFIESTRGAARQQHVVLAFHQPVALGSVVFPYPQNQPWLVKLSLLKPGAPYPPNADDAKQWLPFSTTDTNVWAVWSAPENTKTRALRITFQRGADDLIADLDDAGKTAPTVDLDSPTTGKKRTSKDDLWFGAIEGMKLLARRFARVPVTEKIRVSSGKLDADGVWDAQRTAPVSEADPGIYLMEWREPQPLRGIAIQQMHAKRAVLEAYTGASPTPPLAAADGWEKVGEFTQARHYHHSGFPSHNGNARYFDSYVDFGREVRTRALRVRVVEQFLVRDEYGFRADHGAQIIEPTRCRLYGVAPLRHLGGDAPVDPLMNERIEVLEAKSGKIIQELPLTGVGEPGHEWSPGNLLAFNPRGELFATAGEKLLRLDLTGGPHTTLATDLLKPTAITADVQGNLYVFDVSPERRHIHVYAPDGKFLRTIGTPGGYQPGPWDPQRLNHITALAADSAGHLWAVDWTYWPKRISQWTTAGKHLKDFFGPTAYGSGGALDPWDKRRLFYGPLEFELDWTTGKTRLKNLTWTGTTRAGDIPIRVQGRDYLVTSFHVHGPEQSYGAVYLHTGDRLKFVAAVGQANGFEPFADRQLLAQLGTPVLANFKFIFTDRNGDGAVQADEIVLTPKPADMNGVTPFQSDLSVQAGRVRWVVKEFLPNGTPVYEEQNVAALAGKGRAFIRLDNGNYHRLGGDRHGEGLFTPTGDQLWSYASEGPGVQQNTKPWRPDQVVSQFAWVGHDTAPAGDLGEFVVVHANYGAWNIWTADGLFAGQIFRDLRTPAAQAWSMPERPRGMRLDDATAGQEHFWGWFTRSRADNKYYVVAGHNHASVLEVTGLDRFKRFGGELTITAADLQKAQDWERQHEQRLVYQRAPVLDSYRFETPPKIDGNLADWPFVSAEIDDVKFRIGHDDQHLYVAYEVRGQGPFRNTGTQWDRLFKTGASVDLQLALDPAAPEDRQAPVAGDQRLLLTVMGDEPAAVLYQSTVPGTPADKVWRAVSPVAEVTFDRVTRLTGVRLAHARMFEDRGYLVEAAIPLKALGLTIRPNLRLKFDWGILASGRDGNEVLRRIYWSNQATTVVADAPSEARLHPNLWGHLRFHAAPASSQADPTAKKSKDKGFDDLLNELK